MKFATYNIKKENWQTGNNTVGLFATHLASVV